MGTITIKDLKSAINELPDEMPVLLLDLSTDDDTENLYNITHKKLGVDDVSYKESGEETKAFTIAFDNKLATDI